MSDEEYNLFDDVRRNMYNALPCPKCKKKYRIPRQNGTTECTDCGFIEPWDEEYRKYVEDRDG